MNNHNYWKKCSVCKKEISHNKIYFQCSISSCRKFSFCSVECWDVHSSVMNHKSAGADEYTSPSKSENNSPRKLYASTSSLSSTIPKHDQNIPKDILVVASKFKQYVKNKHDLNTAANVMPILSDIIRILADKAVDHARSEGRKTLMDRDFENITF